MMMAMVKGTIMAVQAVFEIHMERNMEQAMNPSMISAGLVPTRLSIARAILVQNIGDFWWGILVRWWWRVMKVGL